MDQNEDPRIERAKRLASRTTDQTTYQRLWEFVEELRQRPANFGRITAGPRAGTWSSGCRQKLS
jgi:hypothetical protein